MSMQQLADGQLNPEIPINENTQTLEHQSVYGKRQPTTTGFTWGYYGGRWGGNSISDGTFTLTDSTTTYIVVNRSTGASTASTSNTNWNDTGNYARVYKLTTDASSVTATEDHRAGPFGAHGQGSTSTGSVTSVALSVPTFLSVSGSPVTSSGTLAVSLSGTALPIANGGTSGTSASAARTALGLAIGSDVLAYAANNVTGQASSVDSEVALFSGTSGAVIKRASGSGYPKLSSGVLSVQTAAQRRVDLGEAVAVLTDSATIAVDASLANNFRVTLGGNRTLGNPTNLIDGQVLNFRIEQDATGSRTLGYGGMYKFAGGSVPVVSTAASSKDFMCCQYDATDTTLFCVLNKAFS